MAPPVVRGRAAVRQRLVGLVFLAVLSGLVALTIALYQKAFTPTVDVVLQADRAGNQLSVGADVKVRGVIVGEVRSIEATEAGAELGLALDPEMAGRLPSDASARLLPTTLFGEKYVALLVDDRSDARPLQDGDVIAQDQTTTGRELAEALDSLLPLLQTLEPQQVSTTLNALSTTLRGRGDAIGENLALVRQYFAQLNPELPVLEEDFRGLADFADNLDASADDLLTVLRNLSEINRDLVDQEGELDTFLRRTAEASGTIEGFVAENEERFIALAAEGRLPLELFGEFAPQFPCLADGLTESDAFIGDSFGGLQPGLHITLEFIEDRSGYVPGDEPEYLERVLGPSCRGLVVPEVPFPEYANGQDGYRDGQDVDERTGERSGGPPAGPGGPYTYRDQRRQAGPPFQYYDDAPRTTTQSSQDPSATPSSPASYDRAAIGIAVAPALGVRPQEVPDVAVLLFGPVARGTLVRLA